MLMRVMEMVLGDGKGVERKREGGGGGGGGWVFKKEPAQRERVRTTDGAVFKCKSPRIELPRERSCVLYFDSVSRARPRFF